MGSAGETGFSPKSLFQQAKAPKGVGDRRVEYWCPFDFKSCLPDFEGRGIARETGGLRPSSFPWWPNRGARVAWVARGRGSTADLESGAYRHALLGPSRGRL
jgi:hypothetical protein